MIKDVLFADSIKAASGMIGPDAVFLGGGTEINRLDSFVSASQIVVFKAPEAVISEDKGLVRLPLGTTFQMVVDSPVAPECLKEAALYMGSRQKREMASVAGNLYLHRDDSYMTSCLRAAEAQVQLNEVKTVDIEDYLARFDAYAGMIITCIMVPAKADIAQKRIAVTVESHAVLTAAANAKAGFAAVKGTGLIKVDFSTVQCEKCVMRVLKEGHVQFNDDIFGSAEYKEYLCRTVLFDLFKEVR